MRRSGVGAATKTYNYLRIGILLALAVLAVAIVTELVRGEGTVCNSISTCGSISAFYYTPVHSAFVGTLFAVGLVLVAIKGRPGAEDTLLNAAGALAPVVAFVPTPLSPTTSTASEARGDGVPADYLPGIANNVIALVVVGAVALVVSWVLAAKAGQLTRANVVGLASASLLVLGFGGWFWLGHSDLASSSFVAGAHYLAAIPLFVFMALVVEINARHADERTTQKVLKPNAYRATYRAIAVTMGLVLVAAGALFAWQKWGGGEVAAGWLFWVETILLLLFATFWLLQTLDYWRDGAPDQAVTGPDPSVLP